jgi:hypothetical protein
MPNATLAEWLIARFVERSRASSIVGDLLEVTAERGSFSFWLSVGGVVLSLTWRHLTAFGAALLCLYLIRTLEMPPHGPAYRIFVAHKPPNEWAQFFAFLALIADFLLMATPYAVICYGFRDRFAQLAVALCIPFTVIFFFWSVSAAAFTSLAFAVVVLLVSVSFPQGRRAFLALTIAITIGYVGLRLTIYLSERYLELAPPSVTRTVVVHDALPFFAALILVTACAWTHRILLGSNQRSANTSPTT